MTSIEAKKELARKYARLFLGSADGQAVLADLRKQFGVARLSFERDLPHRHDAISAAITDGERGVMLHLEGALTMGAPEQGLEGYLP